MKGERYLANRLYRRFVDSVVERRFVSTDMFHAATPAESLELLGMRAQLAKDCHVELMVHASTEEDMCFLMQDAFLETVEGVVRGTYRDLSRERAKAAS